MPGDCSSSTGREAARAKVRAAGATVTARARAAVPPLRGEVTVPGDKSISHRALVLGALSAGRGRIVGANTGLDVRATAAALTALGARCRIRDNGRVEVDGCGVGGLREPDGVIDAGNSGTTIRTMLGVCAGIDGLTILTGDDTLRRRPMLRVVAPLRQMGARIDGRRGGELPPLAVRGGGLRGVDVGIEVASAQVKTAILLAGLHAEGVTRVTEPGASRDHTERMLRASGVEVGHEGHSVSVRGGDEPAAGERRVPGDISSAMFLIVAALLVPGSDLTIRDVGLNPTRTGALDVLGAMGAELEITVEDEWEGEPVGTVRARASALRAARPDPRRVPLLIDEVPILAVAAAFAEGETAVTGAGELRVKESDRVASMVNGLRALGADVEELPDGLVVRGPAILTGGAVESRGDHRVAMAFAVAGLRAADRVRVEEWSCVDTSFPEFLEVLGAAQARR